MTSNNQMITHKLFHIPHYLYSEDSTPIEDVFTDDEVTWSTEVVILDFVSKEELNTYKQWELQYRESWKKKKIREYANSGCYMPDHEIWEEIKKCESIPWDEKDVIEIEEEKKEPTVTIPFIPYSEANYQGHFFVCCFPKVVENPEYPPEHYNKFNPSKVIVREDIMMAYFTRDQPGVFYSCCALLAKPESPSSRVAGVIAFGDFIQSGRCFRSTIYH